MRMILEPSLPSLSAYRDFIAAMPGARGIDLCAYTLSHGTTETALIAAARAGAHVHVQLDGAPFFDESGGFGRRNAAEVANLRTQGVDAVLDETGVQHAKTAIIDGVAYLDDKNWTGGDDLIVRDGTAADVAAIRASELRRGPDDGVPANPPPGYPTGPALEKWSALRAEASVIGSDAAAIDVATESFGPSTVSKLLRERSATAHVRLILTKSAATKNARARNSIAALQAAGVEIRTSDAHHKLAVAGTQAWVGSANASGGGMTMSDWGIVLTAAGDVARVEALFWGEWATAKPLAPQAAAVAIV